jgi:hypothetical protein
MYVLEVTDCGEGGLVICTEKRHDIMSGSELELL